MVGARSCFLGRRQTLWVLHHCETFALVPNALTAKLLLLSAWNHQSRMESRAIGATVSDRESLTPPLIFRETADFKSGASL
jgi:hypothetical protein